MDEGRDYDAVIVVDDLSYRYPKAESLALDAVSLSVRRGEIFGLLGPSGAGKSTLQRILTRQIRGLGAGRALVLGRDIAAWNFSLYERIGVGFELPNHYLRLTGRENLKFFAALYRSPTRDPNELLALVGLAGAADKRVGAYSKGMMVRLNFARALLHDPELLFLDEPTTGLDPTTAGRLKDAIAGLRAEGRTIILTTHNMHDAEALCDRVGFIAAGRLRALGAPAALKLQHGERILESTGERDGQLVTERFPLDGLGENAAFLDFIKTSSIRTMHSQEAGLDDVFRNVTGVELERGE